MIEINSSIFSTARGGVIDQMDTPTAWQSAEPETCRLDWTAARCHRCLTEKNKSQKAAWKTMLFSMNVFLFCCGGGASKEKVFEKKKKKKREWQFCSFTTLPNGGHNFRDGSASRFFPDDEEEEGRKKRKRDGLCWSIAISSFWLCDD